LRAYNTAKCDCPEPAGGAYSASPDRLAGFKGATLRRVGGGGRDGREREERAGRRRSGGEGRLTLMRSWNRAIGIFLYGSVSNSERILH